jgi:hypothetical protein
MPASSTNIFGSIFGSHNAPTPVPGGYGGGTNPGALTGATNTLPGITPYNTPSYNSPTYTGTDLQGLNSGISGKGTGVNNADLLKQLTNAYGKGTGSLIDQILANGTFNPNVAAAFLNAQQPGIARGENDVLNAFGGAGARYSSAASLGLGDYLSQVQLSQQQTLAGLYENSQQQELSLLSGVLPTLHQEQADKGGWIDDLVGGLEIAGGIALTVATAGAAAPVGAALAISGGNELSQGISKETGGSGGGSSSPSSIQALLAGIKQQGNTPTGSIPGVSTGGAANAPGGEADQMDQIILDENAGNALGGVAPGDSSGYDSDTQMQQLLQMLQLQQGGNA